MQAAYLERWLEILETLVHVMESMEAMTIQWTETSQWVHILDQFFFTMGDVVSESYFHVFYLLFCFFSYICFLIH